MATELQSDPTGAPAVDRDRHSFLMGHGWMMSGCVVMLLVVTALVVSGAASAGVIVGAGLCAFMMLGMMAMMTLTMSRGRLRRHNGRARM